MPGDTLPPNLPDLGVSFSRREAMSQAIRTGKLHELPWAGTRSILELPEGTCLDERYEVLGRIGVGGYGGVFDGRDRLTDRRVAIKVLGRLTEDRRRRMHLEIAVLRRLDLPCVVEFLDEGDWEGRPFVVMPFEEGESFPGTDHDGTWATLGSRALALVEALARVHDAGVLHRDLKPDNVLWVDGAPVLLDFGLAESEALLFEREDELVGSPAYMAPEQYLGEPPSERSDLYSLGVLLYESLCGELPFEGDQRMDIVTRILTQEPVSLAQRVDLPEGVAELIATLLTKDPSLRMTSAAELVRRLREMVPDPDGLPEVVEASTPSALEVLFAGPELVHHLCSDPAQVLWRRTGGQPERVRGALAAWVRAGVASVDDAGKLEVSRDAADRLLAGMPVDPCRALPVDSASLPAHLIEVWSAVELAAPWASVQRLAHVTSLPQLEVLAALEALQERGVVVRSPEVHAAQGEWFSTRAPPRPDGGAWFRLVNRVADALPADSNERLRLLVAAGRMDDLPEASRMVAQARRREGRQREAWVAARVAMVAERRMGLSGGEGLALAADIALDGLMHTALSVVELEARRQGQPGVAELVSFAQDLLRWRRDRPTDDWLVDTLPARLEPWPDTLRAYVMQAHDVDEHAAWVETQRGRVSEDRWAAWASRVHMRRGELVKAAELAELARRHREGVRYAAATINAAHLWCDAGEFERSEELVDEVERLLHGQRAGTLEAFVRSLRITLAYRRGETVHWDPELDAALRLLDAPRVAGSAWFEMAASAWRRGDRGHAREALGRIRGMVPEGSGVRVMADALAPLVTDGGVPNAESWRRADAERLPPGIRLQVYAAFVAAGGTLDDDRTQELLGIIRGLRYPPAARRELFSAEEMVAILEGRRWAP